MKEKTKKNDKTKRISPGLESYLRIYCTIRWRHRHESHGDTCVRHISHGGKQQNKNNRKKQIEQGELTGQRERERKENIISKIERKNTESNATYH